MKIDSSCNIKAAQVEGGGFTLRNTVYNTGTTPRVSIVPTTNAKAIIDAMGTVNLIACSSQ